MKIDKIGKSWSVTIVRQYGTTVEHSY